MKIKGDKEKMASKTIKGMRMRAHSKNKGVKNKVVDRCKGCGKQLPKNNKHHFYCQDCWENKEIEKGNYSLIGGLKYR